ncbi:TWiK family of potassium channels protein 7-like [Acanthaster planci]|uniref:TWiK family of potassium channels protein 7-like n=1 Tax=Acanthaster planci TaxID=133434 RepID=A0A8B7YGF1_ACAPL|nr:TWiK family of potassium channels protein 7-like [Acanthaster planci]
MIAAMPNKENQPKEGCLTRGLRTSWPHFVLLLVYLAYLGIGGGIFLALEGGSPSDFSREVAEYEALKAQISGAVRNVTEGREVTVGNLTELWETYTALVNTPYLDKLTYLSRVDWTFTGSVLFCATSIATIGYGDAVPVTTWGRVVIVIYSLIGIPLTLTFLADIGGILARMVELIARKCSTRPKVSSQPRKKSLVPDNIKTDQLPRQNGLSIPSADSLPAVHEPAEDEGNLTDMRLSLGVFMDSADPVRSSQPNSRRNSLDVETAQQAVTEWASTATPHGIGTFAGSTNLGFAPDDGPHEEERKTPNGPGASTDNTAQETADDTDYADSMQRQVPVLLVVAILLIYTFLGALMIAYVEEWYYGEALYFTFVTLTTIGFGDFVPVKHYMDIPSFIGCLVYTIVGLSVMSMCIALVQAKVVSVMSKVAGKIGF